MKEILLSNGTFVVKLPANSISAQARLASGQWEEIHPEIGDAILAEWPGESDLVEFSIDSIREDEDGVKCVVFGRDGVIGAEAVVDLMINQGVWYVHTAASQHLQVIKVAKAAAAMFDGSGGGIGDLKRAVKEFEEKKYRIYTMMADRRVTCGPHLFKTPDDAARCAKEFDLAADLGLHEYLAVQDETTEKIVKYL